MKYLLVIIVLLMLLSCNQNNNVVNDKLVEANIDNNETEYIPLLLNTYVYDSIIRTDSIQLNLFQENDTLNYIYKIKGDTSGSILDLSFYKSLIGDSSINIYPKDCPLIAQKKYLINGKEYDILKYYFDLEASQDEEQSFFYNKVYGLLVTYDEGWGILANTLVYDSISNQLVDCIISDKSGFYEKEIPPPPSMFIDSGTVSNKLTEIDIVRNDSSKSVCPPLNDTIDGMEVLRFVDKMPEFIGGQKNIVVYLSKNINLLEQDSIDNLQHYFYVSFVIDTIGKVRNPCIMKPKFLDRLTKSEKEIIRVVASMPNWSVSMHNGKKVPVRYHIPIKTSLY